MPARLAPEASGHLVGPPVFKIGGTESLGAAGSIPVRLRRARCWLGVDPRSPRRVGLLGRQLRDVRRA